MTPYYTDSSVTLHHADALEALRTLPDASVDAVCTDPPAGIHFMGRAWDHHKGGREQWSSWLAEVMRECFRVAKPGAHAVVWALPRTSHWTACGLEDAGWEIRDRVAHIFASGFPKSLDVSRAIDKAAGAERDVVGLSPHSHNRLASSYQADGTAHGYIGRAEGERTVTAPATDDARRWTGWGTALKPATEDWWMARKPLAGTVAANVQAYGTGALNIDACRVGTSKAVPASPWQATDRIYGRYGAQSGDESGHDPNVGRWPSNVVLSHAATPDGADLCGGGCVEGCPVAQLDAQSGVTREGNGPLRRNTALGVMNDDGWRPRATEGTRYTGEGGGSRFFPVFRYEAKADSAERPRVNGVAHPTVKPLALMRWLVRLVTPPGGVVLDPFAGSGTTAEACVVEGFSCIAVEREADYLPLIVARLSKPIQPVLIGGDG